MGIRVGAPGSGLPVVSSNVVVDHEPTGIVVRQTILVTTSPPDFRPGLLLGVRAALIKAPDGSPGVWLRHSTNRSPRIPSTPDPADVPSPLI
jgi:hypothetical protein